jgi:extracellular elastinolytic metalloproteinase
MIKEIDQRDFSFSRATAERSAALESFASTASNAMPGEGAVRVRKLNAMTGTPARLEAESAPAVTGDLIAEALQQVRALAQPLGFEAAGEPPEFAADPHVQKTSGDVSVVHLQQRYRGVPVFQMTRSVQFTADRQPRVIAGDHAPLPPGLDTTPRLPVNEAILVAARHLAQPDEEASERDLDQWGQPLEFPAIDLSQFQPEVIASFGDPSRPTVLASGPFAAPITARLVLFYMGPETRLGWLVTVTLPEYAAEYVLIVAADKMDRPEILYCQPVSHMALGSGNVYTESPGRTPRQLVPFPRPTADYPNSINGPPAGFPAEWIEVLETVGNNVRATLGDSNTTLAGQLNQGRVIFDPQDDTGDDQKMLNIFYFCNFAHDFFLLLGFDEASGNFQLQNPTGAGAGNDRVSARAHSGTVNGTANMLTPEDGSPPIMNMGLVASTGRHTAFDADVVVHEFVHGVTNRLVGGRMNRFALQQPQSRGMGEGWSDYFALSIQNLARNNERFVTGDWVVDDPGGIREFPYDSGFPDGFGQIGTGRYRFDFLGRPQVHNIGEIWCATLMEITRRAVNELDDKPRAYAVCWQIVVDALKLTTPNPNFLDARDAILQALDDLQANAKITAEEHTAVRRAAWTAFAHFGLGPNASSNGAGFSGIVEDTNPPNDL